MSVTLTQEQSRAIQSRGKVIVSASAGSGKTFVMIERLVSLILSGADVRRTLAVTFTNKAAAQMKERLRSALLKRIGQGSGEERARLKEQLASLPLAEISTIHAFCARLVRSHFYLAGVDPAFRIISPDDAEGMLLSSRAVSEVFEQAYETGGEEFETLLSVYFHKKKDAKLKSIVLSLYSAVRGSADYREILQNAGRVDKFGEICAYLEDDFKTRARFLSESAEDAAVYFAERGSRALNVCADVAAAATALIEADDLFAMTALETPKIATMPSSTKAEGEELRKLRYASKLSTGIKELYKELKKYALREEEYARYLGAQSLARGLASLVLSYDEIYIRLKKEAGVLDYDDLEHCALAVLENAEAREAVREKYDFVFVDEYQDVNPAQERILSLVCDKEVFLVGDAKQSIYGFRGSRSEFFTQKACEFENSLVLTENFRSASAVLEAVNRVFCRAMTEESCGISYSSAPMRGGSRYGLHAGEVLFHTIAEEKRERTERGVYSVLQEAVKAEDEQAGRIADLIEEEVGSEWFDADAGLVKRVTYGDIAVLVRKMSGDAEKVVAALSARDIPVTTTASVNVCDFWEARLIIDWLSYLDNAEQDIPLAGALLSRIGGFTDGELAEIRLRFPSPFTFRAACRDYAAKMRDGISEKLNTFAQKTAHYRALMRVRNAAEMIDLLLAEGLEAEIAAKKDGEARLRRVRRLAGEASGSVNDFLRRLKALGYRVEFSESGGDEAVKVLTMHAGKGLEYPVVILASLDAPFHGADRDEVVYTDKFSFAPKSYDLEKKTVSETVLRRASALYSEREGVKGELNLLYVAMTRAKYRLHMMFKEKDGALSPRYAKRFSDFIDLYDCSDYFAAARERERAPLTREALAFRPDAELLEKLRAAREKGYPYPASVLLPVKSSATDLMKEREGGPVPRSAPAATAEEGLAYHAFLENCIFGNTAEDELARMKERGLLSEEQLALLDTEKLEKILALPAIKTLAGKRLWREQTFLVSLPACEIEALHSAAEDEIVIQGAIDLLCEDEAGYLILDYKFSSHDEERVKQDYAPQLALYKKAVAKVKGVDERTVRAKIVNILRLYEVEM